MIRDSRRNDKYFEEYIICQNRRIEKFKNAAEKISPNDKEKRLNCFRIIANFQKDLFSAKYSIGAGKEVLKEVFDEYIATLIQTKTNEYAEYADALSIGVLLDYDMKKIESVAFTNKIKDGLTQALLNKGKTSDKTLIYADYYQVFFDYLMKKISVAEFEKFMRNRWYKTNSDMAWFNSDSSTNGTYTGYWCWLAGACLKIRQQEINADTPYIPIDLV